MIKRIYEAIKKGILKHEKSNVKEIMGVCASALTLATYCYISPELADYQGKSVLYYITWCTVGILFCITLWEVLCLIGYERLHHTRVKIVGIIERIKALRVKPFKSKIKIICIMIGMAMVILFGALNSGKKECYTSIIEFYGMPIGVGEPMSSGEREKCAGYWEIKDYRFRNCVQLTYKGAYEQLELMQQYSTAYGMTFFESVARMKYTYTVNKEKYRSYEEQEFYTARKNDYREPEEITYYNSSGKLILKQKRNSNNNFEIVTYSSKDMPQLFNSTLLWVPDGQTAESVITSKQIETRYNSDGLPMIRRLNPRINNQNGVNGERYSYDESGRLIGLCYLDINGEPTCSKQGIMKVVFQYEEDGHLRSIRYYGDEEETKKTEGFNGVFCEKFDYDANGNLIERRQLDQNENWRYDENGVYMYRYTYANGALIGEEFLALAISRYATKNTKVRC